MDGDGRGERGAVGPGHERRRRRVVGAQGDVVERVVGQRERRQVERADGREVERLVVGGLGQEALGHRQLLRDELAVPGLDADPDRRRVDAGLELDRARGLPVGVHGAERGDPVGGSARARARRDHGVPGAADKRRVVRLGDRGGVVAAVLRARSWPQDRVVRGLERAQGGGQVTGRGADRGPRGARELLGGGDGRPVVTLAEVRDRVDAVADLDHRELGAQSRQQPAVRDHRHDRALRVVLVALLVLELR